MLNWWRGEARMIEIEKTFGPIMFQYDHDAGHLLLFESLLSASLLSSRLRVVMVRWTGCMEPLVAAETPSIA
jgi:hypothetical protein